VLGRDVVAVLAFVGSWLLRRPLAWATAAVGLYAIWDYGRAAAGLHTAH
jgi:hypothetical protein